MPVIIVIANIQNNPFEFIYIIHLHIYISFLSEVMHSNMNKYTFILDNG